MAKGGKKKLGKSTKKTDKVKNPLFDSKPKSLRAGTGEFLGKRDLTRFVKWPRYILFQRQKRILLSRIKVPPQIHQFSHTLDKNQSQNLYKFLTKYIPESATQKKERLLEAAKQKQEGKIVEQKKPVTLKYGLNHITSLVENKQAKLVAIAHDVDPIELVLWLPQLCRKNEVPFCFIKGKALLGKLVHKKTATAVALTDVKPEDKSSLDIFQKAYRTLYLDNLDLKKQWGGNKLGIKSQHHKEKREKALEQEQLKKANL
eukprot:TRINITY_DN282_c0_g1_i25.p1 TRINITY_DN282_c0_g1~~TRINITY_DN282_c0_g1_i25.p1  ORF type:complete len:259 (+),score=58.69 TRINITY_DN282_c0_g1_i25:333-1109(+)